MKVLLCFVLSFFTSTYVCAEDVIDLTWDTLASIPFKEDFYEKNKYLIEQMNKEKDSLKKKEIIKTIMKNEQIHNENREANINFTNDYDNKKVKMSGFVVPIALDGMKVTEFYLVPTLGACIHIPPPPANQIIYVKSEKGLEITSLQKVYSIKGVFSQKSNQQNVYMKDGDVFIDSGYEMVVSK